MIIPVYLTENHRFIINLAFIVPSQNNKVKEIDKKNTPNAEYRSA